MNYTPLIITLALCLCIVPAIATSSDYTSKYANPSLVTPETTGILTGHIRCGYNVFTTEIGIRNDILGDKGEFTFYPINADGKFWQTLIPGNFTLYLKDGNGGQPEYSHAVVAAGRISNPEIDILGHAISPSSKPIEQPVIKSITICSAVYIPNEFKCTIKDGKSCYPIYWIQTDVKSKVQALVNTMPSFAVSNDVLGGDPAYGWQKRLDVIYVNDGGSCKHLKDLRFASAPEWTNYDAGVHGIITF